MNDCSTCAYRTTCNQRYRGQDCKYWKGETMSDIQPTEAERGEARKCLGKILDHFSANNWHLNDGVMMEIILTYRADAVKAERERLDKKIRGALCNSPNIFVTSSGEVIHLDEACKIVRSTILSDDREAHRG